MTKLTYKDTLRASYLGYVTQAIVNNFAPLLFLIFQEQFGIPLEQITLLITLNFLVQLVVDMLAAKYVDRIGNKVSVVAAQVLAGIGLAGLALFPALFTNAFHGLLLAVVIYGMGGGLLEVLLSPIVEAVPTENKAGNMSILHSFYCWGTMFVIIVSTLFLFFFGQDTWPILAIIWAIFAFGNGIYYYFVPINVLVEEEERLPLASLLTFKSFWLFCLLMFAAGASEQAVMQWASAFVESGLGISKTLGDLLGPTMFALFMGIARLLYAKYSQKIDIVQAIFWSSLLCVFAYLTIAFAPHPTIALIGCALTGFSVGILWPGVFSMAAVPFRHAGTAIFAILALAGDVGAATGPTIVGFVASQFNNQLEYGFLVATILPLSLVLLSGLYQKCRKTT
ncbi:MFS transporter [Fundicoccus culcitae]|uniref:MFS transporter n=1 Tax=Fundicoccus culcitae TaxID=2969821 RepID=A0ABY5P4Z6_9LACT|nr:MFS transporter [Fundicoccus culcitae]UUX33812.1 MFS transporter [Fundicoccus culcitae]